MRAARTAFSEALRVGCTPHVTHASTSRGTCPCLPDGDGLPAVLLAEGGTGLAQVLHVHDVHALLRHVDALAVQLQACPALPRSYMVNALQAPACAEPPSMRFSGCFVGRSCLCARRTNCGQAM